VPKDAALGLALCAQAAQAHSAPAMLKLGGYHQSGRDVPQDLAAARSWYAEAARHGAPEGQYRLGLMLAQGEGGPPDLDAALHWLESAAAAGFAPAYLPTAQLYASLPVQANSGALAPEHLAKIYLWTSAAKAAAADAQQRVAAGQLEAQVLTAMPVSWRPALDRRVTEHLAKSSPGAASAVVVNR
jgi:TPR repeat protein